MFPPPAPVLIDEIGFSVLKYRNKVPVLAVCSRCQLKFLTPTQVMGDSEAATEYLWRKYSEHTCAITLPDEQPEHRSRMA
jgi:hypothetical protein